MRSHERTGTGWMMTATIMVLALGSGAVLDAGNGTGNTHHGQQINTTGANQSR